MKVSEHAILRFRERVSSKKRANFKVAQIIKDGIRYGNFLGSTIWGWGDNKYIAKIFGCIYKRVKYFAAVNNKHNATVITILQPDMLKTNWRKTIQRCPKS